MMLHFVNSGSVLLLGLVLSAPVRAADGPAQPPWIRDLEAGKKAAQASGKDLMIVFTGHGWCVNCDVLDREVFQHAAFFEEAGKSHIMVELDLVLGESTEDKVREKRFGMLKKEYLIHGVPTVVLADGDGRPYAFMTGHRPGSGPITALAMLRTAQLAKKQRDASFQAAARAVAGERAQHLHKGIQSVAWLLGSLQERGDDPVLVFYRDQIAEIEKDDSAGNVRELYAKRRSDRDAWLTSESVFEKLKKFSDPRDNRGAIEFIQNTLPNIKDRATRWRLERARQTYLEWDKQYAEALENARRLHAFPDLRDDDRQDLLRRQAFNLFNLKRIDEGTAVYDGMIAEERDHPKKRLNAQWWKAQMLSTHGSLDQAVAGWREYRDADQRGTEKWTTATSLLAYKLRQQGKHGEAITLTYELLDLEKNKGEKFGLAWTQIDAAESHVALGEKDKATALIREAEAAIESVKKSERHNEKEVAARIQKRIDGLREQLAAKSPKSE